MSATFEPEYREQFARDAGRERRNAPRDQDDRERGYYEWQEQDGGYQDDESPPAYGRRNGDMNGEGGRRQHRRPQGPPPQRMAEEARRGFDQAWGAANKIAETAYSAPGPMLAWPARAGLLGLEVWLCAWRDVSDASRRLVRQQQDMMIDALRAPLSGPPMMENEEADLSKRLTAPVRRISRAYEEMGGAMLETQRRAQRRSMDAVRNVARQDY